MKKPPASLPKWKLAESPTRTPPVAPVDQDLAVQVHRQADRARLRQEANRLHGEMTFFESRYRMGFEEFAAHLAPGASPEQEADYLAWSKLAERYRMLLAELERG